MSTQFPFRLLEQTYADAEMQALWSGAETIRSWIVVELALAEAQTRLGVLTETEFDEISRAMASFQADESSLWDVSRNVGYPILGLVRQMSERLPAVARGRLHLGATTQDIMDTALSLQVQASCAHLDKLLDDLGQSLTACINQHRETLMAARTHARHAVPTTFGAKLSVYLIQIMDEQHRLQEATSRCCLVSLHGAGGTSAAMAPLGSQTRTEISLILGLGTSDTPWHAARNRLLAVGQVLQSVAAICTRLARETIDLGRDEIGELSEPAGHHRGASSTMPQKANPIIAESIIGFGIAVQAEASGLTRAVEAQHERSAGEWQAEWILLPQVFEHVSAALKLTVELVAGLVVDTRRMRDNVEINGLAIMAESAMIALAPRMGREEAHDLVYEAVTQANASALDLRAALSTVLTEVGLAPLDSSTFEPRHYLGDVARACDAAVAEWDEHRRQHSIGLSGLPMDAEVARSGEEGAYA